MVSIIHFPLQQKIKAKKTDRASSCSLVLPFIFNRIKFTTRNCKTS